MKKQLVFLTLLFSFFAGSAQFKVIDKKNTIIKDGHVYTFNKSGGFDDTLDWYVKLKVKNILDKPIFFKIICDDLIDTDGTEFKLCTSAGCFTPMKKGESYPNGNNFPKDFFIELRPNSTEKISFVNDNEDKKPKKWVFRIQQFDSKGENAKEIGAPVSFTYAFDPNMSINEVQLESVSIYPTLVHSEFSVLSKETLSFFIYDLTGRIVKKSKITSGESKINISGLASQPYLVRFTNDKGKSLVKKIIVK